MLTHNKNNLKTIIFILMLLVVAVAGLLNSSSGGFIWAPSATTHKASVQESWVLSEIYIKKSLQPLMFIVNNDKLIILGSDDSQKKSNVIAIDVDTGKIEWRVNYDGDVIAANKSNIIVGGSDLVMALNSFDGKILWRTNILANITGIIVKDNLIHATGAAGRYYILDADTGKVLQKNEGISPSWQDTKIGDIVYTTNGNREIVAVNKKTNIEIWRVKAGAISPPAAQFPYVYAINLNDNVVRLDASTGLLNSFIKFDSSPPLAYSVEYNTATYSYYVAIDSLSRNLFVYLGDSAQLFSFRLEN